MRCVIALMQHETNTFSPLPTPLPAFGAGVGLAHPPRGEQAIEVYGGIDFAFSAMLDEAKKIGAEISVPIAAYAEPAGLVDDAAFERIADAICEDIAKGCDAVLLDLHGAMVAQSFDDGEGELLKRIRRINPDVPIAVALDFHANITRDMVEHCNVLDGYRTYPHIDMYETGQRAARSLFKMMRENIAGKMIWRALPMMTHMLKQTPLEQPMKDVMDLAANAADTGKVLNASVFGGFPLADIPHVSLSAVCVEAAGQSVGEQLVDEICDMAWRRRADFVFVAEPLRDSIATLKSLNEFPILVIDHGDHSGAGGSADDLTVLDEMVKSGLTEILAGPIWDPQAVAKLIDEGEGATLTLEVGGNTDVKAIQQIGHSMHLTGKVSKLTDGRFVLTGPMQTGLNVNLGRSAIFTTESAELLICEERWEPYDLGCFTHAGVDATKKRYVMLKARQHFRAGIGPIAKHIVLAAGPGICSSDYDMFPFRNLQRPIYPLDANTPDPDARCFIQESGAL